MAPPTLEDVPLAAANQVEVFVSTKEWAEQAASIIAGKGSSEPLLVHLWIDTGFGRGGCPPEDSLPIAQAITSLSQHLSYVGTGTYIEGGGSSRKFDEVLSVLIQNGIKPGTRHAANGDYSGSAPYDLVRVGGQILKGSFEFRTQIRLVKRLPVGHCVSYSCQWRAKRPTTTAVLPVGYAEGYPVRLSGTNAMVGIPVLGKCAPVIGKITMNQMVIDITDLDARVGDEVVLFGKSTSCDTSALYLGQDLAKQKGLELMSSLSACIPRVLVDSIPEPRLRLPGKSAVSREGQGEGGREAKKERGSTEGKREEAREAAAKRRKTREEHREKSFARKSEIEDEGTQSAQSVLSELEDSETGTPQIESRPAEGTQSEKEVFERGPELHRMMVVSLAKEKNFTLESPVGQAFLGAQRHFFLYPKEAAHQLKTNRLFKLSEAIDTGKTRLGAPAMSARKLNIVWSYLSRVQSSLPDRGASRDWRILDIGSGTGWSSTLLAGLVKQTNSGTGTVTGLELAAANTKVAKANLQRCCADKFHLASGTAPTGSVGLAFETGDGWQGFGPNGPYDVVHIEAFVGSVADFEGTQLVEQLRRPGGAIFVTLGRGCYKQNIVQLIRQADGTLAAPEVVYPRVCFFCEFKKGLEPDFSL
eukprot:gnl/MRDRNA2_/MRDRNA2_75561_c0_seq1.p1 gnl/MRDRNA2_/MRDRNA2_75561_c0~~gnl/MRDRNA2_/MRDRNA2_75561_c0_seq1.p1  ORF type:complete len:747 (-),score=107.31 gnl/MRDRNA2_/MRDRNA2_75561_c0_seq1:196-2127(-)